MLTLLYAPPASGKTLAAIAACPNARIATPKASAILGPATLYGLDLSDSVTEVKSLGALKAFVGDNIAAGPIILDDLTPILERLVVNISRKNPDWDNYKVYGKLKELVVPFFQTVADDATHPVLITTWERAPKKTKDVEGEDEITPGGPALPGTSVRDMLPGLCEQVLRVEGEDTPTSAWPFVLRARASSLWRAKCRTPASVPDTLPVAVSALYRAAGYECAPMFPEQAECRERALHALADGNPGAMGKLFGDMKRADVNLHAVAYAVTEAKVDLALAEHSANLHTSLAGAFF